MGGEDARNIAFRVRDIGQYLLDMHNRGDLDTNLQPVQGKVVYHASCAAKLQHIEKAGSDLLRLIPGLEVEQQNQGCCGFDGSFGFKKQSFDLSNQVGADLFKWVQASGASKAVTDCQLCEVQIADGAHIRTAHPVEVLARAYGY
ncbi:MAG: heterodisulfide reductase-related iron-sulfur binding cluster [Anaerolineaceae bacterium]|nr:heterodisulfide reductase-related iron-sulfur binding cluster [Anaerolineaceae bacterium]